ncbi:hypothetical protein BLOT_002864 [Blomia tropicalis]|nr:hypothetical protein BLOT_002864 [Blomia tropicalis]
MKKATNKRKKKFNYKNKNEKSAYSLIYNTGFKRTNFSVTMNKITILGSQFFRVLSNEIKKNSIIGLDNESNDKKYFTVKTTFFEHYKQILLQRVYTLKILELMYFFLLARDTKNISEIRHPFNADSMKCRKNTNKIKQE